MAKPLDIEPKPPEVTAFAIEGPVWLPAGSPARALFAEPRRVGLLFLATSVESAMPSAASAGVLSDAPGRLGRALPLFLTECAFLHMRVDAITLVPWVKGQGFAVMRCEWSDTDASEYARNAGAEAAVALHFQETGEKAEVQMRLVRARAEPGEEASRTVSVPLDWRHTGTAALQLWSQLAHWLLPVVTAEAEASGSKSATVAAARYRVPAGPQLDAYLLRLEQLLAVRCAGSEKEEQSSLNGPREMVGEQLRLALNMTESLPLRLILHETLLRLRDLQPEIVSECRRDVELLQKRYPLADADANPVLERQLQTIFPE